MASANWLASETWDGRSATDRFVKNLLALGPEPTEFEARKRYDQRLDAVADPIAFVVLKEIRREANPPLWLKIWRQIQNAFA